MSSRVRRAQVVSTPLSVDRVLDTVRDDSVGGIGLFVGVVRDTDQGQGVRSLDYTAHPTAEEQLLACAQRVAAQHDVVSVAVEHRVGHLEVGDLAVVVAVGAVHRAEALNACHQLIDDLKAQVPIWKEQAFTSGDSEWIGLT
jgi:molybdopterin synthase catalytic subunit